MQEEKKPNYNRRDFLTAKPVRDLLNLSESGRSQQEVTAGVVEGLGELGVIASLVILARKGSQDKLVAYNVNAERTLGSTPNFEQDFGKVEEFESIVNPIAERMRSLYSIWRSLYRKEYTYHTTTKTSNGGIISTPHTVVYWTDPPEFSEIGLDHEVIENWAEYFTNLSNKTAYLRGSASQAFDLLDGSSVLYYPKEVHDQKDLQVPAMLGLGAIGLAFALYEEGISKYQEQQSYGWNTGETLNDKFRLRRTFLKITGATAAYLLLRRLQINFANKNNDLLPEINAFTNQTLTQLDVGDSENFHRFFQTDPERIISELASIQSIMDKATSIRWGSTLQGKQTEKYLTPSLQDLGIATSTSASNFDRLFRKEDTGRYQIDPGLTKMTKYLWASEKITNFVQGKRTRVELNQFLNATILALGLAGWATLMETTLLPFSEKVKDKLS